ncbi:MAG: fatty acid desaturase, partial [Gemmatimonadales bacterium]
SSPWRSVWQITNSFIPFIALWYLMYRSLALSYWVTLLLAIPTAGFLIRIFIIQHDCGHRSFFDSRKANDLVGRFCSVITLTPYAYWRRFHASHHASSGKLDHRGEFDIPTLTVREYRAHSRWGRMKYRLARHPLVLFGIGSTIHFVVRQRFPALAPRSWRRERRSIALTNLAIGAAIAVLTWLVGLWALVQVQAPVSIVASAIGLWLFYVQHQFEDTWWDRDEPWTFAAAGMEGSSYYKLPAVLQWFTGNIGIHHIHHLSVKIPNYKLPRCLAENRPLRRPRPLTLLASFRCASLTLWEEDRRTHVRFRDADLTPARRPERVSDAR